MRFWNWIKVKSKTKHTKGRRSQPLDPRISQALGRVKRDIKKLHTNLATIDNQFEQQAGTIAENTRLIHEHTTQLAKLEEIVREPAGISPLQYTPIDRLEEGTNRSVATKTAEVDNNEKLDMQILTQQEKRIMEIFLTHRNMALSYQDIAKSLNKSPHTIKNQMREIIMKAPLFEKSVEDQHRNRFKLKKHLKIESNLDID